MAILGSFLSIVLSLAVSVLMVVSWWVLYGKMGEPGWKCLVPFYGEYTLFKRVWSLEAYVWYLVASAGFFFAYMCMIVVYVAWMESSHIAADPPVIAYTISNILGIVLLAVVIVFSFMRNLKISKVFGHGAGYCFGITFLPAVFIPILAFGSDQFVDKAEVEGSRLC